MYADESAIRQNVRTYVWGAVPLDRFREWLAPLVWNADQRFDQETAMALREIDLFLAEFDHGDWTEQELKQHLAGLVADYRIRSGFEWMSSWSTAGIVRGTQTRHVGMTQQIVAPTVAQGRQKSEAAA